MINLYVYTSQSTEYHSGHWGLTEEADLVNQDGSRCNIFSRSSDEYPEVPEGDLSRSKQSVQ